MRCAALAPLLAAALTGCGGEKINFNDCVLYAANLKVIEDARHALDRRP